MCHRERESLSLAPLTEHEEPFGPARPDAPDRGRRFLAALTAPVVALLFPDRGVPPLVSAGRFRLAMAIVVGAALLSAVAVSLRVDVGAAVRAENSGAPPPPSESSAAGAGAPQAEVKTDREIAEEIAKRTAVIRVNLGLSAALGTPGKILLLALALFLLGRYVGGKPTTQRALAAAAVGALPWAVRSLITAAAALRQEAIGPSDLGSLVAGSLSSDAGQSILARLAAGVDLFTLWSVVLCGFGLAAASGISRVRGFVVVSVGFVLLLLLITSISAIGAQ